MPTVEPAWPIFDGTENSGVRDSRPGVCFYCDAPIGSPHGAECVVVCQLIRFRVLCEGKLVGTFDKWEPYSWDVDEYDFHLNHGSWCSDNAIDEIDWLPGTEESQAKVAAAAEDGCSCNLLSFEFEEVVISTPTVQG